MKIKIITGFRENQYYTIDANEAHKAYYLFEHPEARAIFSNGVALIGKNIQGIEPDWNAIMGFNPTYELVGEDWNIIHDKGYSREVRGLLQDAKLVAQFADKRQELLQLPLKEAFEEIKLLETKS